jgi:hypothetical protein
MTGRQVSELSPMPVAVDGDVLDAGGTFTAPTRLEANDRRIHRRLVRKAFHDYLPIGSASAVSLLISVKTADNAGVTAM